MKKIMMICVAVAAWVGAFAADNNTLSLGSVKTIAGAQNVVLTVNMANRNSVSDLQFDLVLPSGVSVMTGSGGTPLISVSTGRGTTSAHSVSTKVQSDGSLRVVCTSSSGTAFTGTSGAVLNISLSISSTISTGDKTILLKNIVLSDQNASYTPKKVSGTLTVQPVAVLTFILEGETLSRDTVVVGTAIAAPAVAERTGYTFSGWGDVPALMPNYNLTFTATYTLNHYVVLFTADGKEVSRDTLAYGSAITSALTPQAPAREGYTFLRWDSVPATMPAHDVECVAVYAINSYVISFVADGNEVSSDTLQYGAAITAPAAPQKEGYTFLRWDSVPATMPAHDVECAAVYAVNSYIVRFVANGMVLSRDTLAYGTAITSELTPQAPAREGFTFLRWDNLPATMPAHDVTATADYSYNKYLISFLVDDAVVETDSVFYYDFINLPEDPGKDGYTFVGWQEQLADSAAATVWIGEDYLMPAHDVVAVAVFTQDAIRGDVNGDDAVNSSDAVAIYNIIAQGAAGGDEDKADLNNDGVVNSSDVVEVFNIIAAKD